MSTIHIAEGPGDETTTVPQLFAGDTPAVVTRDIHVDGSQSFAQYAPLTFDPADNLYKAWAPGGAISAITAYAVPLVAGGQRVAVYVGGCFNVDAIAWPTGTGEADVEDAMNANASNSLLQFRKLLYSDKRVAVSGLAVGPNVQPPPEVPDV